MPIRSAGIVLPMMISAGDSGETSSCSKVPSSRSRATDSAVTISPMSVVRMATSAGTVLQVGSRFGLNQTRATTALGGVGARRPAASSAL